MKITGGSVIYESNNHQGCYLLLLEKDNDKILKFPMRDSSFLEISAFRLLSTPL